MESEEIDIDNQMNLFRWVSIIFLISSIPLGFFGLINSNIAAFALMDVGLAICLGFVVYSLYLQRKLRKLRGKKR